MTSYIFRSFILLEPFYNLFEDVISMLKLYQFLLSIVLDDLVQTLLTLVSFSAETASSFSVTSFGPTISCVLFLHIGQGPHFNISCISPLLQVQSLGLHIRDMASEFWCFAPGRYSTVKLNCDKISIQRAILPLGSRNLNNLTRTLWSVL